MPGEVLSEPNPPAIPSNLPDSILSLKVDLKINGALDEKALSAVKKFRRCADYLAASMIFLKDNVLLERELVAEDIKPRLLGHWGTCPGLNIVYAHLNLLIQKYDMDMILVVGPGHGAPAILASLWIEGSLARFYHDYGLDGTGLKKLITGFSTPDGFPSHINAQVPGSIHEGGELGYALAVAFGAVMDKPDLVVTCIIGDGEAETGPTATAWHGYKYIDPQESGAVIPILHVNGFKISERTIFGCMDEKELIALFSGYGYQVRIVNDLENIDLDMAASLDWAYLEIRKIQKAARDGKPIIKPRWPMLILKTPKGWGAPKENDGKFIEGSFNAHQVPLPGVKSDKPQLQLLQEWLKEYRAEELFQDDGKPIDEVTSILPSNPNKRLGQVRDSYAGYRPPSLPDVRALMSEKGKDVSCMKACGELVDQMSQKNEHTFRVFSPDELSSNKLDTLLEHTGRNFQWDQYSRAQGGRVVEILSEHTCQGMLQGYILTGRTGLFPSYESFLGIVTTMMIQFSKFGKMARETQWRMDLGSINYLETSTWTRQEHNGFSHQNPSFIGSVLNLKPDSARVYLPPDANCFLSTLAHCLESKNYVNLMVGSKQPTPVWLSPDEAEAHCRAGASIFKFCSTDSGIDPDVTLVGIGCETTFEVISAAAILRRIAPTLRVRVVNVTDLMVLGPEGTHPHAMGVDEFNSLFTKDRDIVINYHGYSNDVKGLLFGRGSVAERVTIEGYREEGSTTTPLDMMLRNHVSRYHVAIHAIRGAARFNKQVELDQHTAISTIEHEITEHKKYILKHGKDMDNAYDVPNFD
ncbi:putative D-xylulose 5-phosphate/D-fructose 6-phosphate phosphoketolase [Peziza echinospora]|nr:putative D-xylulose 5-phosphate/D-fructose 6-phosphate phosphoketolase [Peziza echinospora]